MQAPDYSPFNRERTDKAKLTGDGTPVPCRICLNAFRRIRLTFRYCDKCEAAFCEGEHGNFAHGRGRCVQCGPKATEFVEP